MNRVAMKRWLLVMGVAASVLAVPVIPAGGQGLPGAGGATAQLTPTQGTATTTPNAATIPVGVPMTPAEAVAPTRQRPYEPLGELRQVLAMLSELLNFLRQLSLPG